MPSFVQIKSAFDIVGATPSLTFDTNVAAAGAIAVCIAQLGASPTVSSIADTQGNSYTAVRVFSDTGGRTAILWIAFGAVGGACTVTITFGGNNNCDWAIVELDAATVLTSVGAQSGSSMTHAASNVSNVAAEALFFQVSSGNLTLVGECTAGDGYTERREADGLYIQTKQVAAVETNDGSFTTVSFRRIAHVLAVFEGTGVPSNSAPVADAGPDQAITLPVNLVTLAGSATDDGLPSPPAAMTHLWTKTSGPGTVTFSAATTLTGTATFEAGLAGTYVLRLTSSDSVLSAFDEMSVVVSAASPEVEFPPEDNVGGDTIGLSWREIYHVDAAGDPKVFLAAPVDLNDPLFYYGGYKEPRILSWGEYIRSCSDDFGNYESAEFSWVETDTDRMLRGWMGNDDQRYVQNRQVIVRMIDDASRRLFVTPRTLVRGVIRGYKPRGPLHFEFRAQDFLTSLFGSANMQKQIPQEAISRAQFPTCPTDAIGKPVPILFGDLTNALSASAPPTITGTPSRGYYTDGVDLVAGFGDLTSLASIPTAPIVTAGTGGSGTVGSSGTYYDDTAGAVVTAVDVNGVETDPVPFYFDGPHGGSRGSFATAGTVPTVVIDGTKKVTVSWTASAGASKYRVYLGYYYFGFRPQLMKEVTAPTVTVDFTADTDGTVSTFAQVWRYSVSAVLPDGETGISQEVIGIVRTHRREVRVAWIAVATATAYRIRRKTTGGDWDRMWEVAAPTVLFDDDLLDTGATFIDGIAGLTGVIPLTYVGIEQDDDGFPWHAFLVAGHQVHEITGVFQNGVVVDQGNYGVTLLVPGETGYSTYFSTHTGTPQYVTVNSRRYTKIYARGPIGDAAADGSQPFSIHVKGRRDEAGTFQSYIGDVYRDFVLNFGFQDAAGDYLPNPEWPEDVNGDTLTQIDLDSFDTLNTVHVARLVGGYPGAIAFGADGAFITLREAIAQLNVSADCESFFDRNSRFKVSIFDEDPAVAAAARSYTQLTDIIREQFDLDPKVDEVENIIVFSYRRNYVVPAGGRGWDIEAAEDEDAVSVANLRESRRSRVLELHGIRVAGPALDIAARRLVRKSQPPVIVELKTNLYGLSTELGDVITVTHLEGASSSGWTLRTLRVKRHITNPQNYTVRLICEDVQRLYDYYNP